MANVYVWLGHGRDICDPVTHEVKRVPVPEGVTFMQTGLCGLMTYSTEDDQLGKFENPANLEPMRRADPTELKKVFGSISKHSSSDPNPYANTISAGIAVLINGHVEDGTFIMRSSGLQEIPFKHPRPKTIVWNWAKQGPLPISEFTKMYVNSAFPLPRRVEEAANSLPSIVKAGGIANEADLRLLMDHVYFRVPVDTLLKIWPGIHYHTICRSVSKDCIQNAIAARSASASAHKRSPYDVDRSVIKDILHDLKSTGNITEHEAEINSLSDRGFGFLVHDLQYGMPEALGPFFILDLVKKRMKESGGDPMRYELDYRSALDYSREIEGKRRLKVDKSYAEFKAYVQSLQAGSGRRRTQRRRAKTSRKRGVWRESTLLCSMAKRGERPIKI